MTRTHRALAAVAAAAVILLALVPAASAHISVNPSEAAKGSFTVLAFRVPNERDNAGTATVEINFPTDHPIPFISVRPHPGWTYTVERTTLDEPVEARGDPIREVVSKVTFTGGPIRPGEFDQFEISAGPLPEDTDQLLFPAIQTYEGGEVVRWIEESPASGEEPEHPAPVLRLVEGSGDDHDEEGETTETTVANDETAGGLTVSNVASEDDVDTAQTLAVIALIIGALGLIVGGIGFLRRRSA
ncbi:MAG: YcnI family protein [Acidimicrobiales bacterium]